MWLARDYYNILFFFWTKYYKLGLLVLVLSMQFSGFCFYWMMHFYWGGHAYYLFQDEVFTDITWPVISSGSSAFCLLSQLKYWKDILNTAVLLWPSNSAEFYSRGALCEWKMVLELMLFKKIMRLRTSLSLNLVANTKSPLVKPTIICMILAISCCFICYQNIPFHKYLFHLKSIHLHLFCAGWVRETELTPSLL